MEDFIPIVGNEYVFTNDGRVVRVTIVQLKTERVEVIIGDWNPFWINFSDLKEITNENRDSK